ncbi:MAG: IS630 transposase-related protein, partial [Magnetovibrionaceae bacterium]
MGKPYSLDLRERIVAYVEADHSAREAARVFGVSASTAVRLVAAYRRTGCIAAKPQGRAPGTAGKLRPHMDLLIEFVRSDPDITLHELSGALEEAVGVRANVASIHR